MRLFSWRCQLLFERQKLPIEIFQSWAERDIFLSHLGDQLFQYNLALFEKSAYIHQLCASLHIQPARAVKIIINSFITRATHISSKLCMLHAACSSIVYVSWSANRKKRRHITRTNHYPDTQMPHAFLTLSERVRRITGHQMRAQSQINSRIFLASSPPPSQCARHIIKGIKRLYMRLYMTRSLQYGAPDAKRLGQSPGSSSISQKCSNLIVDAFEQTR